MVRIVRVVCLIALTLLALSLVIGVARPETGAIEKIVLGALAAGVVALAIPVRRLGAKT